MKKYRIYIWTIVVLGIIAIVLYSKDNSGTLGVDSRIFAVSDTGSVTRVRISNAASTLILERQGTNWTINGEYNARPKAIKALLGVISSLEISTPVPKSVAGEVFNSFSTDAVTISVEASGEILKSYRIAENDSLRMGSFFMLAGEATPYIVRITGFDGRISKLFPADSRVWRNKTVFQNSPSDILSVEVVYPTDPESSFGYYFFGKEGLKMKSLSTNRMLSIDKESARNYLMNFASVPYQVLEMGDTRQLFDSLKVQKSYCQISLKDAGNQLKTVKLFQVPSAAKKGSFDLNRMYAVVQNDTVPVFVKFVDIDPIMKRFSDFVGK